MSAVRSLQSRAAPRSRADRRGRARPSARRAAAGPPSPVAEEICASAAAMITRCFSPPLRVSNCAILKREGSCRRHRLARDREIAGPFDLEGAKVRVSAHHHHFERGVVEREVSFLRHDRHTHRQRAFRDVSELHAVEHHACPRDGLDDASQRAKQGCLSRAIGTRGCPRSPRSARRG